MSREQCTGRNHNIKTDNNSFRKLEQLKYLWTTSWNKGQVEAREWWLSFGAKYLSSNLLFKNIKIKIYRSIILPVVLYGFETQSLIFREVRRLKVLENGVLGKEFGPKRDEVPGEWRRLRNKELCDRYCTLSYIWVMKLRMRWAGHVARMWDSRGTFKSFCGELWEKEKSWKT